MADGYPITSAAAAIAAFQATGTGASAAELTITDIRFGVAPFPTDRGQTALPAWLVSFANVRNLAALLAVAPAARFTPPSITGVTGMGAHLDPSGAVTVTFWGDPSGTGPCTADYSAQTAESTTAIAVSIQETRHTGPGPCTLMAQSRSVTLNLARPLGARVLVDAQTDAAIAVQPLTGDTPGTRDPGHRCCPAQRR